MGYWLAVLPSGGVLPCKTGTGEAGRLSGFLYKQSVMGDSDLVRSVLARFVGAERFWFGAPRLAKEWPSEEARQKYLREHPRAKPEKHTVRPLREKGPGKSKKEVVPEKKEIVPTKEPSKPARPKFTPQQEESIWNRYKDTLPDSLDGHEVADLFRGIDQRKTRMEGLQNARRLIPYYYRNNPAQVKVMSDAIDEMIEQERKNPTPIGLEHRLPKTAAVLALTSGQQAVLDWLIAA